MIPGVDVSHYQTLTDIDQAVAVGAQFVIVKTSDGLANDNPNDPAHPAHDAQVARARSHRVAAGHYHFARHVGAWAAEADHFLDLANAQPGDTLYLDLENMDGTWAQRVVYALHWLARVHLATGARPFWYCNKSWRSGLLGAADGVQRTQLTFYPLWIATGGVIRGQPGVSGWAMHQYATTGGVDRDVLADGLTLNTYAIPGEDVPLTDADRAMIADENWHRFETPDGKDLATALIAIYGATVLRPAIDPVLLTKAITDALAAHPPTAAVDPAPIAAAVLAQLTAHPLTPKP